MVNYDVERPRRSADPSTRKGTDVTGREILHEEQASPNYRLRQVRRRRTGEESWEVLEASSGLTVVAGLADREEGLRIVRGWERLSQVQEGGLPGHILVN